MTALQKRLLAPEIKNTLQLLFLLNVLQDDASQVELTNAELADYVVETPATVSRKIGVLEKRGTIKTEYYRDARGATMRTITVLHKLN